MQTATIVWMAILTAILLPGLDGTGDLFAPFVDAAPEDIATVVVRYPIDEAAIGVLEAAALTHLVDPCIVIAESFSGPIAVRVAADPRVRALILCNSFVSSPFVPFVRYLAITPLFKIPLPRFVLRTLLLGSQPNPNLLETTRRTIAGLSAGVVAKRVRQVLVADERPAVRELAKPILYLRGRDDNLLSKGSWRVLKHNRPDAQIAEIEGPHMLLQASPGECWKAILEFVKQTLVIWQGH